MMPARRSDPRFLKPFIALATLLLLMTMVLAAKSATMPAASHAAVRAARTFFVAESADATWVIAPAARATPEEPASWAVLRRSADAADAYWSPIAALSERPIGVAPFGERLAVLYADGSWSIVSVGTQASGPPLPEGAKPIAIASNLTNLVFLTGQSGGPSTLIDFDGSAFSAPRVISSVTAGPFASLPSAETSVAVDAKGGVVTLLRLAEHSAEIDTIGARGSTARSLSNIDDASVAQHGGLFAARAGVSTDLGPLETTNESRRVAITLPPAAAASRLSVTRDAQRDAAKFWWLDAGAVFFQPFDLAGKPLGEPIAVMMQPAPTPPLFERILYVAGAATLLMVLLAGGRQTLAASRALAGTSPPAPAPLARRMAAGVIDLVPLAAVATYLAVGGKLTIFAGMLRFDSVRSEAILAAGVTLYLVLLISFELRWQRSIGKAIFALRIVSLDGTAASMRSVLIRNVLRLVDLNIVTLLIVPLTPLRQRLGDFLAGTMVIDTLDAKTSAHARTTRDDRADND